MIDRPVRRNPGSVPGCIHLAGPRGVGCRTPGQALSEQSPRPNVIPGFCCGTDRRDIGHPRCGTVPSMADALFGAGTVPDAYERYLVPPIFKPWADVLVDFAGVSDGEEVLDVASGTGVVAATAAERVGDAGRVVATDVSAAMLAVAGAAHLMIETIETAADELAVGDSSFDVTLCQQGFQFLTNRLAAAQAMMRVLRSSGRVAVAVWMSGPRLEPFDVYGRVLERHGLPEPFPRAYAYDFSMSPGEVEDVLTVAGFTDVAVETKVIEISWATVDDAVHGIAGTPYGPAVATLNKDGQQRIAAALREQLRPVHPMTAVLARGRRP